MRGVIADLIKQYPHTQPEWIGFIYGFLGVLGFSLTLPATRRSAVTDLDPIIVGIGRAPVPAGLALTLLLIRHPPLPPWRCLCDRGCGFRLC
ncbi:MAG: hypothetical protein N2235_12745 [Fischerella sp.]|nr:hypothetical protein [Fischerella sp.]